MEFKTSIDYLAIMILLWLTGFTIYFVCNHGIAHNARGQQFRRYLLGAICSTLPIFITNTSICQPSIFVILFISFIWMLTYPLLYHLTNRKNSPDYDNQLDIAFGIYLFGWLTGILILIPSSIYVLSIIEFVLLMIAVSQYIYYLACKGCINSSGMQIIQNTDYNEIIEFLRSYHPIKVFLVAGSIIILFVFSFWVNLHWPINTPTLHGWQYIITGAITLFITIYIWKPNHGIFIRTGLAKLYCVVKEYVTNNNTYITNQQQRINNLQVKEISQPSNKPMTIMMVIGESASRDFMSAFTDVDVETTPWMSSLKKDKKHCMFFPNAYSCHVQTVPTLEKVLTEYNQYEEGQFFSSCSIVDIAHKLGWKVHWYSNQGRLGAADTPITLVAETADVAKWTHQELNKIQYDGNLIEFLNEVDPTQNNLVVLHLIGSHFNFENRFPESLRQWGKKGRNDNITNYKNSLYYTDTVLNHFHDYGTKHLNLQAMIYFSDHGCVPDRHRIPNFDGFGNTRIPLMIWLSDEYIQKHPDRAKALQSNTQCYWTNDLTYELMCGIFDIESNCFKESNSLASTSYRFTREELVSMDGLIQIKNDNK